MADKTFAGETYQEFTSEDVQTVTIRFSAGEDGQPAKGEPLVVGGKIEVHDESGDFVKMAAISKDATKLSAAKQTALRSLRDDFVAFMNAKLAAAGAPDEV